MKQYLAFFPLRNYPTWLLVSVWLMMTLVGCTGTAVTPIAASRVPATETAVPTPLPTAPLAIPDTPTPTETSAPSSTATPIPTITPTPTPTETPIPVNPVTSITLERVTNYQFYKPTYLTHAGDDRLFVTEQQGVIRIIQNGQLLGQPFLYIVNRVKSIEYEQGLLSVAFHPRYAENGYFFVYYTNLNGDVVISRFRVSADDPNLADYTSEQIWLTIPEPFANHNGGQLQFGPDGYLYVGIGDGGSANDPLLAGQDLTTLLGKLLRLDVDFRPDGYAIPPTNPFAGDATQRGEIWAYGLRNPWRFSFDRLTHDLIIADVGQNLWEEVNFQPASSTGGENYGWNVMEAAHCFNPLEGCDGTGMVLPIFEYGHELGCSITGGYLYRGPEMALYGNYFVSDYCQGTIWGLTPRGDGSWQAQVVYQGAGNVSSFGEDAAGNLYVLDHLGWISRIRP